MWLIFYWYQPAFLMNGLSVDADELRVDCNMQFAGAVYYGNKNYLCVNMNLF